MSVAKEEYMSPKDNNFLLGHKEAESVFLNAWKNSSLHNSVLICGEKGIGKATLAYKIIKFLLTADENNKDKYQNIDSDPNNPIVRQIEEGACYNLKVIERDYVEEDKKKIIKAIKDGNPLDEEELAGLRKSAVIKIDEVRTINEFMAKTSYDNNWRIVLIDSIDDMNVNSANALLKILEEPPAKSMLILISHKPDKLLPTIKSRCSRLNLKPLTANDVAILLRRYNTKLSETEVKKIAAMSDGSIGKALVYGDNNFLKYYDGLNKIAFSGMNFKISDTLVFADFAAAEEENYSLAKDVILRFLSENAKSGEKVEALLEIWQDAIKMFEETARINMDKKQTVLALIYRICSVIK